MKTIRLISYLLLLSACSGAAAEYLDNRELENALRDAAGQGGSAFRFGYLDADNNRYPLVAIGSEGDHDPTVLVIGGLDGRHLTGSALALELVRYLASTPQAVEDHLNGRRVVVVPRLNLEASDAAFGSLKAEQAGVGGSRDADHDGFVGEDYWDDLDGDGMIRVIRVEDPQGTYVEDGDGSFLRTADGGEGEHGRWRVLIEGLDDDQDEAYNEESDPGANPSRNFPFEYPWFERDAGRHQVSLPHTRAVADYLVAHPSIAAVLIYGFEDNLLVSPSDKNTSDPDLEQSRWGRKPVTSPNKHDLPLVLRLGEIYRETLGIPEKAKDLGVGDYGVRYGDLGPGFDPTAENAARGGLAGYVYYHRGRLALATPGWTAGMQMALAEEDTTGESSKDPGEDVDPGILQEEAFRDWLMRTAGEGWKPWTPVQHRDFPDQRTESGGYAPHVRLNPPVSALAELADAHTRFTMRVLDAMPRVRIQRAEMKNLGGGLQEVTVTVDNAGYLPDVLAQGVVSTHARPTRIEIEDGQVLGGRGRVNLDRLNGSGGSQTVTFVVQASGAITLRLISEMAGEQELQLNSGDVYRGDDQ